MKIGVDTRPLSYRLTGIGVYLKHLLDTLQDIDRNNYYCLFSNKQIKYDLKNSRWSKIEGKCGGKLLGTFWMQFRVPVIASQLKLDLFWGPRHHLPVLLPYGIKTVLTIHDIVHILYPNTMTLPNFAVERLLMRWSVLKAGCIITDSISTASGLKTVYGVNNEKIKKIPPGVMFTAKKDEKCDVLCENYFLFVGTLEPRKNFKRILKAFELVERLKHGIRLVVIGGMGWKNKALLAEIRSHPLRHQIHLLGYIDSDLLLSYYRHALCLLFPSVYEGFGFPILEAMGCGTPVITSNISSMPEVAGDAALQIDPYNIDELAKAMYDISTNEKLRESLIAKGFERVKRFSWNRCAMDMLDVFNLLGES